MSERIKKICVFCGSHAGSKHEYMGAALELGRTLAENNIELIYGGSSVGLMHLLAQSTKKHGGKVTGIIPQFLSDKGLAEKIADEIITVQTMHERKAKMMELADAFIALPGGYGTLEEVFEVITASQLSLHSKPVGIANISGFYNLLLLHIERMICEGFVSEVHRKTIVSSDKISKLVKLIEEYQVPMHDKYIESVRDSEHRDIIK